MRCPFCGNADTAVKDSRSIEDGSSIKRRRHCSECSARFSTVEHVQLIPLHVLKKNGTSEPFDRQKISKAFEVALHKRQVDNTKVERIINSIIRQLETMGEVHIPSHKIGEMVLQALSDLDHVAYIRFASVYLDFHAAQDFKDFAGEIQQKNTLEKL
jgi:transcriptional repressor NrdR